MALAYQIKINGNDISKLTDYVVGRNKLYASAERNMQGDLKTSFIGIFPKVELGFTYLNRDEMSYITTLLDNASFTLEWWDAQSKSYKTGTFYAADYDTPLFDSNKELYKPFKVRLVAFNKLT